MTTMYAMSYGRDCDATTLHDIRFEDLHVSVCELLYVNTNINPDHGDNAELVGCIADRLIGEAFAGYAGTQSKPTAAMPMTACDGLISIWTEEQ